MIPLTLSLTNFLSYRETAALDFEGIHLACIAGLNGAGKSSILDGMTWALFGQSRSRSDDDVVNRLAARADETAEVIFDFELEEIVYRVVRRKRTGKAMTVEFLVAVDYAAEQWKALTGSGRRETDAEIERLLRMNYDTFSNASFLLQGRADEFTTKTAGKRKEVLADLLGVNRWDQYRESVTEQRKAAENQLALIDAQVGEIEMELAEEPARQEALTRAQAAYRSVTERLEAQEKILQQARRAEEAVERQREGVKRAADNLAREQKRLADQQRKQAEQQGERDRLATLLAEEEEIKGRYAAWEAAVASAEAHQQQANEHNRLKQAMQPLQVHIEREKSRLHERAQTLEKQKQKVAGLAVEKEKIARDLAEQAASLAHISQQLAELSAAQETLNQLQSEKAGLEGEQPLLKEEMKKMQARIDQLQESAGGQCPVCGQPLTETHRVEVIADLSAEGTRKGDRFRSNKARLSGLEGEIGRFARSLQQRQQIEDKKDRLQQEGARLESRRDEIEKELTAWKAGGEEQLSTIERRLAEDEILPEEQAALAGLAAALEQNDYNEAAHRTALARRRELLDAPERLQHWDKARSAVEVVEKSLAELTGEIAEQERLVAELDKQHRAAVEALATLTGGEEIDLVDLEQGILRFREEANAANRQVGRAEQMLRALDDQRRRREAFIVERAALTHRVARLKMLETACGRNGVQALLIEQALPEIEDAANRVLTRLTDGQMQITFETQRKLKSRDATAETLDIHIADSAGIRPYENFSGGEQFRVNFAIRIALSQILAKRANARLQTLVVDEGFGSQDPTGRQRLIEAINAIQHDFRRILVITHIDELRDAFPNRIDVVKTPRGSLISVS